MELDAKEYLKQVYKIDLNIKAIEMEIEELNALAEGGSINYDERVQTSGRASTESIMCSIVDNKSKLYDLLNKKLKIKAEVSDKIYKVKDSKYTQLYQSILFDRYIRCIEWEKMADEMGYSVRRIYELHGNALESFRKCNP
jgi:hypothetical protein